MKFSIDRVLKNHNLDGVYYDWNVALLCYNPLHTGETANNISEGNRQEPPHAYHWDMDELIELMEWTRRRVGPDGLIVVHNTRTPMFAVENFANYVVGLEWGYKKWLNEPAKLRDLPLEWAFAGARSRGVIGYGIIDAKAPRRLHNILALESFLSGVTPWPVSPEAIALNRKLMPLGDVEQYKFEDWRNEVVYLEDDNCASAVYSRPGEAYILLGNLDAEPKKIACIMYPQKLSYPLSTIRSAEIIRGAKRVELNVSQLSGAGEIIPLPGDDMVLVHIKGNDK